MQSAGYDGPSESQIWELQCASLEILAFWTNVDDSQLIFYSLKLALLFCLSYKAQNAPTLFYDPAVDYLGLADDNAVFNSAFTNDGAFGVVSDGISVVLSFRSTTYSVDISICP